MSLICFQLYGAMTDSAINTWASHENGRRRHVIITSCGQRALSPHHVARDADRRVHRCGEGVLWWPARTYYRHARAKARAGLLLNHHGRMRSTSLCGAGAMHAACAGRQHVGQQMLGGWERRCAAADVATLPGGGEGFTDSDGVSLTGRDLRVRSGGGEQGSVTDSDGVLLMWWGLMMPQAGGRMGGEAQPARSPQAASAHAGRCSLQLVCAAA
jgi:hypothetical protein